MINKHVLSFAREMRKAPTRAEQHLWAHLQNRRLFGYKFRRQHPIKTYIADFACIGLKLVIELDGGHHDEDFNRLHDDSRTDFLQDNGYRVIRFTNGEVLQNIDSVLTRIADALDNLRHDQ